MPLLSCTARTCIYNKDEYCSKGDILVDGSDAKVADETCCRSFEERGESASNSAAAESCGCRTIDVDCRACTCTFNKEEKCLQTRSPSQAEVPVAVTRQNAEALKNDKI